MYKVYDTIADKQYLKRIKKTKENVLYFISLLMVNIAVTFLHNGHHIYIINYIYIYKHNTMI